MWDSYSVWKLCQCCTAWLLLIVLHDNTDVIMWYYQSLSHYHSWEAPFTTGDNMSRTLDTSRTRPLSDTTEHFEDRALLFVIYRPNSFELSRLHQIREIKENLDTCHQSYGTLLLLCCHTLFSYSSSVQETDFMSRVNLGYWNFGHWKWATGNLGHMSYSNCTQRLSLSECRQPLGPGFTKKRKSPPGDDEPLSYSNCTQCLWHVAQVLSGSNSERAQAPGGPSSQWPKFPRLILC